LVKKSKQEIKAEQVAFLQKISGKKTGKKKRNTYLITGDMFIGGLNIDDIARERKLKIGTVLDHLEQLKREDKTISFTRLGKQIPTMRLRAMMYAFSHIGMSEGGERPLKPVYELLNGKYDYDELRLVRLLL